MPIGVGAGVGRARACMCGHERTAWPCAVVLAATKAGGLAPEGPDEVSCSGMGWGGCAGHCCSGSGA